MTRQVMKHRFPVAGALAVPLLCGLLALGGCSVDKVAVPELSGPAELAISLRLQASPDALTANGWSTSAVSATVYGPTGQPMSGVTVLFDLSNSIGELADIGTLQTSGGEMLHAATATASSGSDGVAHVTYRSPARTDLTADASVLISARPLGVDANAVTERYIRIELKSAEPRIFPADNDNTSPDCSFVIQPPFGSGPNGAYGINDVILFQSTASDSDGTIARYEWDFGDGRSDDKPDTAHAYGYAGTFQVQHVCTDDDGAQGIYAATLTVQ